MPSLIQLFSQIILAIQKKLFSVITNELTDQRYKDIIVCEGGKQERNLFIMHSLKLQKMKKKYTHD